MVRIDVEAQCVHNLESRTITRLGYPTRYLQLLLRQAVDVDEPPEPFPFPDRDEWILEGGLGRIVSVRHGPGRVLLNGVEGGKHAANEFSSLK